MKRYAGIGSRETPDPILKQMVSLGKFMSSDWILRSGGARGADSAFEIGCTLGGGEKEIILPWRGFNGNGSQLILPEFGAIFDRACAIAEIMHPAWRNLRSSWQRLHARNVLQIMGTDLESPVDLVICWTHKGRTLGDTATGIRLAESLHIPVLNMGLGYYVGIENTPKVNQGGLFKDL